MKLAGKIFRHVLPRPISYSLNSFKILALDYGHLRSILNQKPVDHQGNPIPWYTYAAIEYIKQLNFSEKIVFEYGAGNSSLFWASQAQRIVSVESNFSWYEKVKSSQAENLDLIYANIKSDEYVKSINNFNGFDVIIIDGQRRKECAFEALKNINSGGMIILDNSDVHPEAASILRQNSLLIQVDMTGFTPAIFYTSTTSFFLRRDFSIPARSGVQPIPGPGSYIV